MVRQVVYAAERSWEVMPKYEDEVECLDKGGKSEEERPEGKERKLFFPRTKIVINTRGGGLR